jgi:hypothetical protein
VCNSNLPRPLFNCQAAMIGAGRLLCAKLADGDLRIERKGRRDFANYLSCEWCPGPGSAHVRLRSLCISI